MIYRKTLGIFGVLLAATAMAGCVWPARVDPTVLNRYQQAMARSSPQQRLGESGLDSLLPAPGATGPALKIVKDDKTHHPRIILSLDEAILRAVANSLDIRVLSFDPAISREDITKAAAQFDYVVFGGWGYDKDDRQIDNTFVSGQTRSWNYQAGLRQKTVTGAEWSAAWTMTRTWEKLVVGRTLPSWYEPTLAFELTQPLLRDGWSEFNLSTLRIAEVNDRISRSEFRRQVEDIVAQVISTYWSLARTRGDYEIQQSLLAKTRQTLDRVIARAELDATAVQIKQSEAAVETRRALLIRTKKVILDVQQRLARLLADAQINTLSDYEIVTTTPPPAVKVQISVVDQLETALRHNPVLEQARLEVEAAAISVRVAKNQTLPRLDLKVSSSLQGLAGAIHESRENLGTGDFASYGISVTAEYPLGNRERLAELRRRRFERLKAITSLQNVADQVAVAVTEQIRQIHTTYEEMEAQRAAVAASRAQLQALEDTERIRGRLTPEFLQVKLDAQAKVAIAEQAELRAIVDYNIALADLARITGTILQQHNVKIALPVASGDARTSR